MEWANLGGRVAEGEDLTGVKRAVVSRLEVSGYEPIGVFRVVDGRVELEVLMESSTEWLTRLMDGIGHDRLRQPVHPDNGELFLEALLLMADHSTYYMAEAGEAATPSPDTPQKSPS
jgi:hypothetical protein